MAQQLSGELASANPTKGEEDARVRALVRRKDFSQCMQQSTTPSTSNVIFIGKNAPSLSGLSDADITKLSPRREPDVPAELLRALFGNVTKPEALPHNPLRRTVRR